MTLFQPEFGLMFWMLVVFLIVLGIMLPAASVQLSSLYPYPGLAVRVI